MPKFRIVGVSAPCAHEDAVERTLGKHGRRVVQNDDLGQIFGDLSKGLFVRLPGSFTLNFLAKASSPEGDTGHVKARPDAFQIGLESGRPDGDFKPFADVFDKRLRPRS